MNLLALVIENKEAVNQLYNTAVGDRTNLLELTTLLKEYLTEYDSKIGEVAIKHRPNRA